MSAVDNGRNNTPIRQRTLLDIIKDDRSNKDKKSWKTFRDKIRLKRAGSAWTSSVRIPASDVNVQSSRSRSLRLASEDGGDGVPGSDPPTANPKMQLARRVSARFGNNQTQSDNDDSVDASMPSDAPPSRSFRPQMTRHASTRLRSASANEADDSDDDEDYDSPEEDDDSPRPPPVPALAEERSLSARQAVAAQEAAEAAAAAEQAAGAEDEPVKMSLMDLLGETGYTMGEDDDEYDEEEEEEEEEDVAATSFGGMEYTCCVCMVKHKGSANMPCLHTFCRLCSRELAVQRGNCPLCNGYILEILDIF